MAATGEHRWMRARAQPRRDGIGAIVAWYGPVADFQPVLWYTAKMPRNRYQLWNRPKGNSLQRYKRQIKG